MVMNVKRSATYYWLKFKRLQGNPRSLARGSAIGAFMAIMPIMPVRTIALITATTFSKASVVAAFVVATLICNPLTYVPLYYFAFITGNAFAVSTVDWDRVQSVLDILAGNGNIGDSFIAVISLGLETITVLLIGGLVLATPAGLITYIFSYHYFKNRKRRFVGGSKRVHPNTSA